MKSKKLVVGITAVALSASMIGGLGIALKGFNSIENTTGITNTDTTSYVSVGELWNSGNKTFNENNFEILYKYLTGSASADYENVASLASSTTTAANIRSKTLASGSGYSAKSSSQDVIVTLGGLKWEVVYLSNNTDGEPTLTLWLSNSNQDAFSSRSRTEGEYYGYYAGGLYSDWSADWSSNLIGSYPSNMYGTSYIRAVTLNNGGQYATNNSTLGGNASKSTSSVFAPFTMDEYGMTDYIVKPTKMPWQRDQSSMTELGTSFEDYTLPNEAIAPNNEKWYSGYKYSSKTNYTTWENDNLWLPSIAETGYSDSKLGMWGLSVNQRKNYDGANDYFSLSGAVGSLNKVNSTEVYTYLWLRSAVYNLPYYVYFLNLSGTNYNTMDVGYTCAVRPALHLNLKQIQGSFVDNWEKYAAESYAGGIGTETNPYIIKTAEQFAKLAKDSRTSDLEGKHYKLGANIDLKRHLWSGIARDNLFRGVFDGDFHTINGMHTIIESGTSGLFIKMHGVVKNLILSNGTVFGGSNLGAICNANDGVISNCIVDNVNIYSSDETGFHSTGGIAGLNGGKIYNCIYKNSNIIQTLTGQSGGIAGYTYDNSIIENCSVINVTIKGANKLGEIKGNGTTGGRITACYASVNFINGNSTSIKMSLFGDSSVWGEYIFSSLFNDGLPIPKDLLHISTGIEQTSLQVYEHLISLGFN